MCHYEREETVNMYGRGANRMEERGQWNAKGQKMLFDAKEFVTVQLEKEYRQ
jgi:hypothetical protein